MLAEARDTRPARAWKESIMVAIFKARWGLAIGLAAASAFVAVAALVFVATPAFNEVTDSFVQIALTGVAPILAILALITAADASSRVLKAPWTAALLAVLGSVATSTTYVLWYAGVDNSSASAAPLLVAAGASIVLNGAALAILVLPALRQLPVGATITVLALVVVFGGTAALLIVFPMASTVLISAAALTTVLLMRRAESRETLAPSV
ncbi:hypothetical protein [Microbacterium sp. YY-01]|uniref:hypothetical protein n=1 Tax=Microbacterium sp. YY-01 TaxID=3421634 RepID=UPI003D186FA0